MINRIKEYILKHGGFFLAIQYLGSMIRQHGLKSMLKKIFGQRVISENSYHDWLMKNDLTYPEKTVSYMLETLKQQPLISILLPVYNVEEIYLKACIDSIEKQSYPHWELCITDDCSSMPHIRPLLEKYRANNSKIKVNFSEKNGHISLATNACLNLATGDYIALVDNDDLLHQDALLEVIKLINDHPDADMIYSDEDKIDATGTERIAPFFKPDWSPDAFFGHMYTCHLGVYRRTIALEIGGMRVGFEGAQDYDFVLRFTEKTQAIYHIPKILYHWRMIPTSTASGAGNKDYAYERAKKAKQEALARRGMKGKIELVDDMRSMNVVFEPDEHDFVSIIIPTKNHGEMTQKCVESIISLSTWTNFEILIIDNGSDEPHSVELLKLLAEWYECLRLIPLPIPFNYATINNEAVKEAKGNMLLFLNNDVEVITPDWLERMIGQAKLNYTGAVGAKLYYEDQTVQHSGIIVLNNEPVHAFLNFPKSDLGYYGRLDVNYNYLAVTGAALMVEKAKFLAVGGFDEQLSVAYNDVDLCLKLYQQSYYNVVRNDVELYHYESKTRGYEDNENKMMRLEQERSYLQQRWQHRYFEPDPFYNVNLTHKNIDFSLK